MTDTGVAYGTKYPPYRTLKKNLYTEIAEYFQGMESGEI
jgi:hypothetical protein